MVIEQALAEAFKQRDTEKTFIDKLLAKDDIARIKELMRKNGLKREELLELLYMLSSSESKLLMLPEYHRYVLLKYFVWVREFVKICEFNFDYRENLNRKVQSGRFKLSDRAKRILDDNTKMLEHNTKFLVDLFLMIARTSLSLNGAAFGELLKQRFELQYSQKDGTQSPSNQMSLRG